MKNAFDGLARLFRQDGIALKSGGDLILQRRFKQSCPRPSQDGVLRQGPLRRSALKATGAFGEITGSILRLAKTRQPKRRGIRDMTRLVQRIGSFPDMTALHEAQAKAQPGLARTRVKRQSLAERGYGLKFSAVGGGLDTPRKPSF